MENSTVKPNPLQGCINRLIVPTAAIIGLGTSLLVFGCLGLVVSSSFQISHPMGIVTLVGVGSAYVIAGVLSDSPKRRVIYRVGNEVKYVSQGVAASILLILCGFIQTFFWVIDHTNSIHEPRSVFILAVAGFIEYCRRQYEKSQVKA